MRVPDWVSVRVMALPPVGLGTLPIDLSVQTCVEALKLPPHVAVAPPVSDVTVAFVSPA